MNSSRSGSAGGGQAHKLRALFIHGEDAVYASDPLHEQTFSMHAWKMGVPRVQQTSQQQQKTSIHSPNKKMSASQRSLNSSAVSSSSQRSHSVAMSGGDAASPERVPTATVPANNNNSTATGRPEPQLNSRITNPTTVFDAALAQSAILAARSPAALRTTRPSYSKYIMKYYAPGNPGNEAVMQEVRARAEKEAELAVQRALFERSTLSERAPLSDAREAATYPAVKTAAKVRDLPRGVGSLLTELYGTIDASAQRLHERSVVDSAEWLSPLTNDELHGGEGASHHHSGGPPPRSSSLLRQEEEGEPTLTATVCTTIPVTAATAGLHTRQGTKLRRYFGPLASVAPELADHDPRSDAPLPTPAEMLMHDPAAATTSTSASATLSASSSRPTSSGPRLTPLRGTRHPPAAATTSAVVSHQRTGALLATSQFAKRGLVQPLAHPKPSLTETPIPLEYPVPYDELYREQRIAMEEAEIHAVNYSKIKELYNQQRSFVEAAFDAMVEGDFLRKIPLTSAAKVDLPLVEARRMRLQRDDVPVMYVRHRSSGESDCTAL